MENSNQEGEECKIYGFTAPNGVISMRLQDISARKVICSQLETLEKRAIIYNFILYLIYSCDFHEGRQHFISLLLLVLNFDF